MKSNASLVYNFILVVGDFLALVVAFIAAYFLRASSHVPVAHPISGVTYLEIFLVLLPFWILIFAWLGLYNSSIYEKRFNELGRLLVGSFIGLLFVVFWNFLSEHPIYPAKLVPIYGFVFGFLFLVAFRNAARLVRTTLFRYGIGLTNVLIVGHTSSTDELVSSLASSKRTGYRVVAVVGAKLAVANFPHIASFRTFSDFLATKTDDIHGIIQTELYAYEGKNRELLEYAQTNHISYRFVPGNTELFVGNISVELFRSSMPVIAVHQTALLGWGRIVKRLFDIVAGSLLLITFSPLFVLTVLLNLIFNRGSVFFRQTRLTRFNNEFEVFKFRTQYKRFDGTTPEQAFAILGHPELARAYRNNGDYLVRDPRVTPFGRFLRRTSIDELPQLFNVIRGDLSLVGPRALIPEELSVYEKRHNILSVKSGLTGLAQVSGRRDISFEERRKLDLFYVQNWSFWLDLIILAKTVRVIIDQTGAK